MTNKDYFQNLKNQIRLVNVDGKAVDLIKLSHASIEQIVSPFLFPNEKNEPFRYGYLAYNAWIPDFFEIYYGVIHESFLDDAEPNVDQRNLYPALWKIGGREFFSFHDCLLSCLLSKFLKKKEGSLCGLCWVGEEIGELRLASLSTRGYSRNLVDKDQLIKIRNTISQAIKDKKVSDFAKKLVDNLIGFKKLNLSSIKPLEHNSDSGVIENIEELFCLLRDNQGVVLPHITNSGLEKYFPSNQSYSKEEIDSKFAELLSHVIRFKKTNKFIQEFISSNCLKNSRIKRFVTKNNVYYEVIGIGTESFFNQKTKMIFPNGGNFVESESEDKSKELLSPKFQNLTIFNHNTKTEETIIEPTAIWLDVKEILKILSNKFIEDEKKLRKINEANELDFLLAIIFDKRFKAGNTSGRKVEKDYESVWKEFIEVILYGKVDESSDDFAQQAFDAYTKMRDSDKEKLKFMKSKKEAHKDSILITIQEDVASSKGIGKTSLQNNIVTPFAKKLSSNSPR